MNTHMNDGGTPSREREQIEEASGQAVEAEAGRQQRRLGLAAESVELRMYVFLVGAPLVEKRDEC